MSRTREMSENLSFCCRIGTFSVEQRVFKTQSCNITLRDRNSFNSLGTLRQEEFASLPRENNQSRIIMSQGVDRDGVVTKSEFMIVQLASDEKLTKRTANRIIKIVKRKDFNPA